MLLSIKLKNQIKKVKPEGLEYHIKNIIINGRKVGCSGFVKNLENGKIVYVNTEMSCFGPLAGKSLYRTAISLKDYTGGRNHFATNDELAEKVVEMLL